MRIVAGSAGGTDLAVPKGPPIRPTPDKVKQAIFSSLGSQIVGARVLDLFCGSGALGLEAVSRGATRAVLVDVSRHCVAAAAANAARAGLTPAVEVCRADGFRFVERAAREGQQFDLILADPPYEKEGRAERSLAIKLLNSRPLLSIVAPAGVLVVEHHRNEVVGAAEGWVLRRQLRHGDTRVSIFERAESKP